MNSNWIFFNQGQWRNDRFHGLGAMQHSSGVIYEGIWIGGRPSGTAADFSISLR